MPFTTLTTFDPSQFQEDNFDIVQQAWVMIRKSVLNSSPTERLIELQSGRIKLTWRNQEEVDEFIKSSEEVGRGMVKSVQIDSE